MRIKNCLVVGLAAAGCAASFSAFATNGILPFGNGMSAHGVGGAGIANPADAMSSADNPALLSYTGGQASVGASIFSPRRSADLGMGGGYVKSGSNYFFIPQAAWTAKGDPINYGIIAYAMGGMNTDYPSSLFGSPVGVDLSGLIVAPTMSYKFTPDVSAGAALLLGYARLKTKGPGPSPGMPLPDNRSDSSTGYGIKLGVDAKVAPNVSLGATYQPKMRMSKMGKFCQGTGQMFDGTDCKVALPEMYGIGGRFGFGEMAIIADIIQANWSKVEVFNKPGNPYTPGWKNQTIFKIGAEFHTSPDWIFRVGYNHGKSPIPNDKVANNVLFPAVTEDHVSVGFTRKVSSAMNVVGYYGYSFRNEQTQTPSPGVPNAKIKMDQHAIGLGVDWRL